MCGLRDLNTLPGKRVVSDVKKKIGRSWVESGQETGRKPAKKRIPKRGGLKRRVMKGRGVGEIPHHTARFLEATQIPNSAIAAKLKITHLFQRPRPSKPCRMIELDWSRPMEE